MKNPNKISWLIPVVLLSMALMSCNKEDLNPRPEDVPVISNLPSDTTVKFGKAVNFSPKITGQANIYEWRLNGTVVSTAASYVFNPTAPGVYNLVFSAVKKGRNDVAQSNISVSVRRYYDGFYVINEGSGYGSVSYYDNTTKKTTDNIFGINNPGKKLPPYPEFGTVWKNVFYVVSKGNWGGGHGSLTMIDINTFTLMKQLDLPAGESGRAFQGIDGSLGILTTDKGAYKVDLTSFTLGNPLAGSVDAGECGDMLATGDYLFVATAKGGALVYDIKNNFALRNNPEIPNRISTGFAQTKDGNIWAGTAKLVSENPDTYEYGLMRINPLSTAEIALPEGLCTYGTWEAWKSTYIKASPLDNTLYIAKLDSPYFGGSEIYSYDATALTYKTPFAVATASAAAGYSFYGPITVHPETGVLYTILNQGWGKENQIVTFDRTGKQIDAITYNGELDGPLFPAMIVFD